MSWETVNLKDVASFTTGRLDSNAAVEGGKYPFFTCDPTTLSIDDWAFDQEALLLAGNNASGNYTVKYYSGKFNAYQRTYIISSKDVNLLNNRFLGYALELSLQKLKSISAGTSTKYLTKSKLDFLQLPFPNKSCQERIVDTLSAYDALIENNRKQIKLLEEAAQRLYKEWFVDMRFPGHESTPINPTTNLPEGWEVVPIQATCRAINSGSTPSRKNKSYWDDGNLSWFKTAELQDCWLLKSEEHITQEAIDQTAVKVFPENSILMAIYASPTLGRLGILTHQACFNQAALAFIPDENYISQEWLYLKLYSLRDKFNSIARGAGQQNISGEIVKSHLISLPHTNLIEDFTNKVKPLFLEKRLLQEQTLLAAEARDRLLPKLMSGEIEV